MQRIGYNIPPPPPDKKDIEQDGSENEESVVDSFDYEFDVPEGRLSDAWGIMRLLNVKFKSMRLGVNAKDGALTKSDLERIREALEQMGVDASHVEQMGVRKS